LKCQRVSDNPLEESCQGISATPIYTSSLKNKDDYRFEFKYSGGEPDYKEPDEVYSILHAISAEDAQLLGFMAGTKPENMIMERLIVIPYCARPDVKIGGIDRPDDLTLFYQNIVKWIKRYNDSIETYDREKNLRELYNSISNLMKNDGSYGQGQNKVFFDVAKRIQGKTAVIRFNIMGKRVNFAGRTVVGPGAYLRVDEIGVPRLMAAKLTRPITVTEYNRAELQSKFKNGQVTAITMQDKLHTGLRLSRDQILKEYPGGYRLQLGDRVERMLQDGDIVLVNRQPTLHKQNILAVKVRLIDDRIIRINLSITTPLNADFDGDEVNIHVPQTVEAYAEAELLLSVYQNIMSGQTNRPIMGVVYDGLTGAYLLTEPEHKVEQLERDIEKLREEMAQYAENNEEYQTRAESINKMLRQREKYKQQIMLDPIVFDRAIETVINRPQYETLEERLRQYGVSYGSGRSLISATFPQDFDYNAAGVVIQNGILTKGLLTKGTIGPGGGIITELVWQLGAKKAVDFMSDIQFVIREYLQQRGFSIGIDDCLPGGESLRRFLDEEISRAEIKVISLSGKPSNQIEAEQRERKISETLDINKTLGDQLVQKFFQPENALLIMANSGAKGSSFYAAQISSQLGQQRVSGKRIPANLPGNRSLPVFQPNEKDPRARGFCYNSFGSGLEPSEYFFHAQGGREGLTDTAVNTAQTGALQHQLIKSAQDICINPDRSVRAADNAIVQFVYGDDGFDPARLGVVKISGQNVPFYRNVFMLADKINRKHQPQD